MQRARKQPRKQDRLVVDAFINNIKSVLQILEFCEDIYLVPRKMVGRLIGQKGKSIQVDIEIKLPKAYLNLGYCGQVKNNQSCCTYEG